MASKADVIMNRIEDADKAVQMEVATRCWTDYLDPSRENVREFLSSMGPDLQEEFCLQVYSFAKEKGYIES